MVVLVAVTGAGAEMKLIIRQNHAALAPAASFPAPVAPLLAVFVASLFFALLAIFVAVPSAYAGGATVIRFPNQSIGQYSLVRPDDDPDNDDVYSKGNSATGVVKVPAGCFLRLHLNYNGSQNSKFIRQLPPTIVRNLTCRDLEIGDKAVADLCTQRDLKMLNLQGIDLTDEGIKSLSHLTKLCRLNISDTLVSEKGLAVLRNMPALNHLNLSRITLGDAVAERLYPLKNLKHLDLTGTQLKDKTVMRFPRFENLHSLVLRRNNLTDNCIDTLRGYKRLMWLDITDTRITVDGLRKLRGMPVLRTVIFRSSSLKPGDKAMLKKELRGVKIQNGSRETVVDPELFAPLH
ncbi:MAG: hypothetical protein C0469_01965 [Cyanobacteria bacterium DS2.3.42]|nr:hypothetical protein [Cyanobacteria bacterium DS2.3.42]